MPIKVLAALLVMFCTAYGQKASGIGQKASGIGQKASGIGQKASEIEQKASGIGQNASGIGQQPSNGGQQPSNDGQQPLNDGQQPSNLAELSPNNDQLCLADYPQTEADYAIVNVKTGKCLAVSGFSRDRGGKVVINGCHYLDNQRWIFKRADKDIFPDQSLYYIYAKQSGKVLDSGWCRSDQITNLYQWDFVGNVLQRWILVFSQEYVDGDCDNRFSFWISAQYDAGMGLTAAGEADNSAASFASYTPGNQMQEWFLKKL